MLAVELIMIVIGLGTVVLSFRVSNEQGGANTSIAASAEAENDTQQIKDEIKQYKEDMLASASEELSRLSNDKLLGMNEYSEEVLARMTKNHEEVVFLYDMLKEKEEDVKDLVHHVDSVKAQIHNETAQEYQKMMDALKKLQESRLAVENEEEQPLKEPCDNRKNSTRTENLKSTQAQKLKTDLEKQSRARGESDESDRSENVESANSNNHNAEIIKLYKEGNSVFDISKLLSIGQGEVKFVVDLYKASR